MNVKAVFCTLMQAAGAMEAAAREMERIGKDAQGQIQRLLQVCPENEGRLLQEAFAACDGLDECGRRMARGTRRSATICRMHATPMPIYPSALPIRK